MALSVKWDEVPQAASCGDFLAVWWTGHTLPHTHMHNKWHCLFEGLWWTSIFPSRRAAKHTSSAACYQDASTWLFNLWCMLVMNITGWQRQQVTLFYIYRLPISYSLVQTSSFMWLIKWQFLYSIEDDSNSSVWQKTKWGLKHFLYLVTTILLWQTGVPFTVSFSLPDNFISKTGRWFSFCIYLQQWGSRGATV